MVIFRGCDNDTVCGFNFLRNFSDDFGNLHVSWFIKKRNIIYLNKLNIRFICKVLLHVFKK